MLWTDVTFSQALFLSSSLRLAGLARAAQIRKREQTKVTNAHCHAGKGVNYGKNDRTSDPWTTYNDPR